MPISLYRPRRPRASPLWQCLSEHGKAFFDQYAVRFEQRDGRLRTEITPTLKAFETCGDLSRGFARLHCDHCGHDYLVPFSCKQRYFCPSCHQKKVQEFGELIRHEVVRNVPHRQVVLTLPKRLRRAFLFDRSLFTDLSQIAWRCLRDYIRLRLGTPDGQPGMVIAIQTFGDYLNFHPHLHILVTDGAFVGHRTFHALHYLDWEPAAELLRHRLLKRMVKRRKLTAEQARQMLNWRHSGFGIHAGKRIQRDDHDALERLAQYILRNPFSLDKMTYLPESGEVIYRSRRNYATKRYWERFDGPAFIAAMVRHIPAPRQHLVRYYGAYSNRARGERRKHAPVSRAAETSLPTKKSLADFAASSDRNARLSRSRAFDRGLFVDPHPDALAPALHAPVAAPHDTARFLGDDPILFSSRLIPYLAWRVKNGVS
ncbi:transposase [Ruficoccus amylovorans]|uniref:Transposase n=1 Tax=Ruficoccus amylovorans TaxID=1804625 RepID=A0A842HEG1_9BACT|nr:transposase [Ruficoccus amylovorans]